MPAHPGKVTLAWIHPANVSHEWAMALHGLRLWDLTQERYTGHKYGKIHIACAEGMPSDSRATARNTIVEQWLDQATSEWLVWIDCDQIVPSKLLQQFMAVADPVERPIVGALCFSLTESGRGDFNTPMTLIAPTIYDPGTTDRGLVNIRVDYERDALVRCFATGSACIIIHRSVMEAIKEKFGPIWYKQAWNGATNRALGEDISFCIRAGECGFPIHVDTRIKTSHDKGGVLFLDESAYNKQQRKIPPPATERVDVIVPVLHRPQNVKPLMDSLRASTGLATAWFVVEEDGADEIQAVYDAGGNVLRQSGTFAQKVNHAVHLTGIRDEMLIPVAPWVFLCGDDVRFHPGWLDHALHTAQLTGAHVIGTNDLANKCVTSGQHATHMLIRREYIETEGASWDGPGIVCHEGYRHWFVDDEIVTVAKMRGVWAPCLASVVEHMHPIAGKADDDEVYALGRSEADEDRRRFQRRALAYAP